MFFQWKITPGLRPLWKRSLPSRQKNSALKIFWRKISSFFGEQMIALASALIMNQNIVLFDESSPNLDYGKAMKLGGLSNG